jgi:hypothetical protein
MALLISLRDVSIFCEALQEVSERLGAYFGSKLHVGSIPIFLTINRFNL